MQLYSIEQRFLSPRPFEERVRVRGPLRAALNIEQHSQHPHGLSPRPFGERVRVRGIHAQSQKTKTPGQMLRGKTDESLYLLEGVSHTHTQTGLAFVGRFHAHVTHFEIWRPVLVPFVGQLGIIFIAIGFIVIAVQALMLIVSHGTARINIVQLSTPVAHRPTNPGIHFIDFIIDAAAVA